MKIPTKVARVEWTFFEHFCRVLETRHTAKLNNTRQNFRAGARTSWWGSLPCVRNLTHGKWRILPCVLLACARQIGTFAVCKVFAVCLLLRHTANVLFAVLFTLPCVPLVAHGKCSFFRVPDFWLTAKGRAHGKRVVSRSGSCRSKLPQATSPSSASQTKAALGLWSRLPRQRLQRGNGTRMCWYWWYVHGWF